jgi:hypothetical protein
VAELVTGIELPCDLVPVVTGDAIDPYRVTFATTGAGAGVVGAALADELERLGYQLRSVDESTALAVRDDAELQVRVTADPGTTRIVVELST